MKKVIFASSNRGKIDELKAILADYDFEVLSLEDVGFKDEIIEDGKSFLVNALIKARTIYQKYHLPTISDDSGLCVLALDLAPGIYSARYKGLNTPIERRRKILEEMEGIEDRRAYFYCQIVYIDEEGLEHYFDGKVDGFIGYLEKGSNGFGYDPIFYIDNNTSLAMLDSASKNKISHRGKALKKLKEYFKNDFNNK